MFFSHIKFILVIFKQFCWIVDCQIEIDNMGIEEGALLHYFPSTPLIHIIQRRKYGDDLHRLCQ